MIPQIVKIKAGLTNKNKTKNVAMHRSISKHENPIKKVATGLTADCK